MTSGYSQRDSPASTNPSARKLPPGGNNVGKSTVSLLWLNVVLFPMVACPMLTCPFSNCSAGTSTIGRSPRRSTPTPRSLRVLKLYSTFSRRKLNSWRWVATEERLDYSTTWDSMTIYMDWLCSAEGHVITAPLRMSPMLHFHVIPAYLCIDGIQFSCASALHTAGDIDFKVSRTDLNWLRCLTFGDAISELRISFLFVHGLNCWFIFLFNYFFYRRSFQRVS